MPTPSALSFIISISLIGIIHLSPDFGQRTNCFSLKHHRNSTSPTSVRAVLWDLTSTAREYHYRQLLSWLHSCYTMLLLKGNTLVPCFGDLFMKACPSQAVLAHSQKAPAIANVFAVGYSIVKDR